MKEMVMDQYSLRKQRQCSCLLGVRKKLCSLSSTMECPEKWPDSLLRLLLMDCVLRNSSKAGEWLWATVTLFLWCALRDSERDSSSSICSKRALVQELSDSSLHSSPSSFISSSSSSSTSCLAITGGQIIFADLPKQWDTDSCDCSSRQVVCSMFQISLASPADTLPRSTFYCFSTGWLQVKRRGGWARGGGERQRRGCARWVRGAGERSGSTVRISLLWTRLILRGWRVWLESWRLPLEAILLRFLGIVEESCAAEVGRGHGLAGCVCALSDFFC